MSDEREDALQAELVAASRDLLDAEHRAHPDAWRCPRCRRPATLRIDQAETLVLQRARKLAAHLARPKPT